MWILMIRLDCKVKRIEGALSCSRRQGRSGKAWLDFLRSAEKLWLHLDDVIKYCEGYMMKTSPVGESWRVEAGTALVDSMFGQTRALAEVERWVTGARLWSVTVDDVAEEVFLKEGKMLWRCYD